MSSVVIGSCGLLLDPDPPHDTRPDASGTCRFDAECAGCAICVAGACVPAAGQPCTAFGRCVEGIYECSEEDRPRCVASEVIAAAGSVCRPERGDCDVAELCDGAPTSTVTG
jgi:hypothetical protein